MLRGLTTTSFFADDLVVAESDSGEVSRVDRETGEEVERGPWLNIYGLACRKNGLIPDLDEALAGVSAPAFDLVLDGVGQFGSGSRSRSNSRRHPESSARSIA